MARPKSARPPVLRPSPAQPPAAPRKPLPVWAIPVAAGVLHLLLCWLALDPGAFPGGDNGTYVALARGILERGVYVDYWDPAMAPHTLYPPVFPLILAAGMACGLSVWVGVKLLCIAISATAVALGALWLTRILPPRAAAVAGLLGAIAPASLALANQVLSDVPFWTLAMLALWAYARADGEPEARRWEVLGAIAIVLGFLTRSAGLPLALAAGVWLVTRRRWRGLGILAASLGPPAVAWWWWTHRMGGQSIYAREFWWVNPYAPELGSIGPWDLVKRIGENLQRYSSSHVPTLYFGQNTTEAPWTFIPAVLLVGLAVGGWALRVRRPTVAELFVPLYIGLLLVWPATWGGERFLLPLLPMLIGYAGVALLAAGERMAGVWLAAGAAAIMTMMTLPGLRIQLALGAHCREEYRAGAVAPCLSPEWSELLSVGWLVRGKLPAGAVVIHRKPTLFFASSGYRSKLYPKSESPDSFFALAREAHADYAVVDQITDMSHYLHAVLLARPDRFCIVRELSYPNATLVRIVDHAPPLADPQPGRFPTCPAVGPPFPAAPR